MRALSSKGIGGNAKTPWGQPPHPVARLQGFYEIPLSSRTSVRMYFDNRPRNLKTAPLHKGLVLVVDGQEVIEEGLGFGAPVAVYADGVLFPGGGRVEVKGPSTVTKAFSMNAVYAYRGYYELARKLARVLRPSMGMAAKLMALQKHAPKGGFVKRQSRGDVLCDFHVIGNRVEVKVDATELEARDCINLVLLNEQGAGFFHVYRDTGGLELFENGIGKWDQVQADRACLLNLDKGIGFCARRVEGARLVRGREVAPGWLSWAGLNYEIRPPVRRFSYSLEVVEVEAGEA